MGFMLGWMPALVLAIAWPLVFTLGIVAVVIGALLIGGFILLNN